ncbi:hypothetical protein GCM10023321_50330 [Pseudonocardia eucalypti]|uniref:Uncharacterized protein n=1 Tax=Pseudonocardia eucalypti TaxID=648755 RepID=A0ABP9QKK4_9PSEU
MVGDDARSRMRVLGDVIVRDDRGRGGGFVIGLENRAGGRDLALAIVDGDRVALGAGEQFRMRHQPRGAVCPDRVEPDLQVNRFDQVVARPVVRRAGMA